MGPGSRGVRTLGVLSAAMLIVAALFYVSEDLRTSVRAAVDMASESLHGSQPHTRKDITISEAAKPKVAHPAVSEPLDTPKAAAVPAVTATTTPRVITTVTDANNKTLEIIDEPIPEDCYAQQHADYAGYAVQWGLGHKARSAAECCRMCKEFKPRGGDVPHRCNIWVWCGDPSGLCWTMDIHTHTTGDCWLKYQASWDGVTDLSKTNLEVNHKGRFSPQFRAEHKTAPEFIPWVAGLVATGKQPSTR